MPKDNHLSDNVQPDPVLRHSGARLLHPNFVLRVAGEPCAPWQQLHDGATGTSLALMQALRDRMAQAAPFACEALRQAICRAGEQRAARRALLAARRAAFNVRPLSMGAELIAAWCAPGERAQLAELEDLGAQLAVAERAFAALFDAELERATQRLRSAAADAPALMGGIHYTNAQLHGQLERWVRDGVASDAKAARRVQSTLLDFAMRAAFKTSPLSSFTPVIVGTWCEGAGAQGDLGERAVRMDVRFNHAFLWYALEPLWRNPKCLGDDFALELNPTIHVENEQLHWQRLVQSYSRHGSFWGADHPRHTIALSAPVKVFLSTAAQLPGPLNLASLTRALGAALPAYPAASVRYFVETMLALNLLHPRWARFQQDDLLADTVGLAARLELPARDLLATAAAEIQQLVLQYQHAELADRVRLRRRIDAAAAGLRTLDGTTEAPMPAAPLFFEDCALDGPRLLDDPGQWSSVLDDLEAWLALMPLFDTGTLRQSWLAERFVARFGAAGVCTDIDAFLRELGPESLAGAGQSALSADLRALKNEILDAALAARPGQAEVRLDAAWCRAVAQRIPAVVRRRGVSQAFFGQRIDHARMAAGFVLNRVYAGTSTLLSRFMHGLSETELETVRAYLRQLGTGADYLELPGVFGFNGNLHPRLSEGELLLPGSQPGRAGLERHRLEELSLVYNAATDRVDVRDRQGIAHDIYYFGFLLAKNLPLSYQLLARNVSTIPDLWEALRDRQSGPEDQPRQLPRVSIGHVVVSRRTWIIPRHFLPDPNGTVHAFALAFHALRIRWSLPADIFVRLERRRADQAAPQGPQDNRVGLGKPFHVNLDSPLHLRQLAGALRNADSDAYIQEALPEPGMGTVRWNGRDHASEMQIEMTLKGERGEYA
jgi:hypothetical protein